jgi:hypothetical protein
MAKYRKYGVKSSAKYARHEKAAKILERHCYLQESQDVRLSNLKMTAVGLPKGTHPGLLTRYNLQRDPGIGAGRAGVQHIPCLCLACCNQLLKAWKPKVEPIEQGWYRQNKDCRLWNVFLGENNWLIVEFRPTLGTVCRQMSEEIRIGQIGAQPQHMTLPHLVIT